MKTAFILLAALVTCISSFAKSSSESNTPQGMIPYVAGMRIMHFIELRNSFTVDGRPMVCVIGNKAAYDGSCTDAKGANAWQLVETVVPPGYRIHTLHYVMSGSSYRNLFVYMVPIQ
jgi:hypothetical protein